MNLGSLSLQHHITGPRLSHGSLRISAVFAVPFPSCSSASQLFMISTNGGQGGRTDQNQQITPKFIVGKSSKLSPTEFFCRAPMMKQNLIML